MRKFYFNNTSNSASTKILTSNKINSTVKSLWAKILDYLCNAIKIKL